MSWLNEVEIDMYVLRYAQHPVLGPATRLLSEFRHTVNANSDGWPYFSAASKSAGKLSKLIQAGYVVTAEQFKASQTPIKAFCTKHKWPFPALADDPPGFNQAELHRQMNMLRRGYDICGETLRFASGLSYGRAKGWSYKVQQHLEQFENDLKVLGSQASALLDEIKQAKLEK